MGGIVAFKWGEQQLTLLQNRDNWEARVITVAAWDKDNKILGGRCELNDGTWFGVSKSGRVAFLVDPGLHYDGHGVNDVCQGGAENFPIAFLEGMKSPQEFADSIRAYEIGNCSSGVEGGYEVKPDARGLIYNLIVADVTSSSMLQICKPKRFKPYVDIKEVPFGVHTLSKDGLDAQVGKDEHLRRHFNEQIGHYENNKRSLEQLAERVMFDRVQAFQGQQTSALFVEMMDYPYVPVPVEDYEIQRYGTTSTTAFAVDPTMKVMFYERHFKQGPHTFTFNIDA